MPAHRCPSAHELAAALRVAAVLPAHGVSVPDARASYSLIPAGGLHSLEDFVSAEALLRRCGLLRQEAGRLTPASELLDVVALPRAEALELLLLALMEREPPNWIFTIGDGAGDLPVEAIPDADWSTFEALVTDPGRREACLLALGRRFDADERQAMGAAGEDFVVAECRSVLQGLGRADLAAAVRRVSLLSDQLGYDVVSPTVQGPPWRLEVKTTRPAGSSVHVTLTRNEAKVGLSDRGWALVVCLREPDGDLAIAGWCDADGFSSLLPMDRDRGVWMDARIELDRADLRPGVPDLLAGRAA